MDSTRTKRQQLLYKMLMPIMAKAYIFQYKSNKCNNYMKKLVEKNRKKKKFKEEMREEKIKSGRPIISMNDVHVYELLIAK